MEARGWHPDSNGRHDLRDHDGDREVASTVVDPLLTWLGLRVTRPVAGLHITSTHLTLAALRPQPIRLVALGRLAIPHGAVADDEIRNVEQLVTGLGRLAAATRVHPGTPTAAAIEPAVASIAAAPIGADRLSPTTCAVRDSDAERITQVVTGAGLDLVGLEIVPAALARIGLQVDTPTVGLRSPTGWSVTASPDHLTAERVDVDRRPAVVLTGRSTALHLGPDLADTSPLTDIPGIAVPDDLDQLVDPGHDAVALGAALAALGGAPLISAETMATSTARTAQRAGRRESRIEFCFDRRKNGSHLVQAGAGR